MKKILAILLGSTLVFTLAACGDDEDKPIVPPTGDNSGDSNGDGDTTTPKPEDEITLEEAHSQLTIAGDLDNVYGNLDLVTSIKEVQISWVSSNPSVVSNTGVVTSASQDQTAKLTATLSLDEKTKTKEFNITVKADVTNYDTISESIAKPANTVVTIKAVVSKVRGNDFFIQDSTGGVFVYSNQTSQGVTEGDTIKLVGKMGTYGSAVQIAPTSVEILSSGSKVEVTKVTDLSTATLNQNMYNIISIDNVNIDSLPTYNQANDYNFNVSVGSNQVVAHINKRNSDNDKASIATVLDTLSTNSVINFNQIVVSQYNGTLQLLVCSGSDIEEANVSTDVKIERIKTDLKNLTDLNGKTITSKLNLVTSSLYSSTIEWTSNNAAISNTGVVTRPEEGQDPTAVTLTYTVTVDSQTFSGTINLFVAPKVSVGDLLPYYESAVGLEGYTLEAELKSIISSGVKTLSYSDIWTTCEEANEDPNNSNNVILFYSGFSVDKDDHVSGSTGWNREHTWPQSLDGPYTDAHHLMPTDNRTNSVRGNNKFAVGGSFVTSGYGTITTSKSTGSTFEPRDEVKGDVARICMYIAVRYGYDINRVISLELAMEWNEFDPVDEFEMNRNEVLYGYQKNRNPFIDNPQFAELIWG